MKILFITIFTIIGSTLLAQEPELVKDLEKEPDDSDPNSIASFDRFFFFGANDGVHGRSLWVTDGSADATRIAKSNVSPSFPSLVVGNLLFFSGNDDRYGRELWKFSGETQQATLVKDIYPGTTASLSNEGFAELNGLLFFAAAAGVHGVELWKSDGTEEGTGLVKDVREVGGSRPEDFAVFNGELYFTADDGIHGRELWRSDGTEEGTELVKDIIEGSQASTIKQLTVVNKILFFVANHHDYGRELWATNGTSTKLVKDLDPDAGSFPIGLVNFNGELFFFALDKLWKSDGSEEGTAVVAAVDGKPTGSGLIILGNELFFAARDDRHGVELWKTDGTTKGTTLVKDIRKGENSSSPRDLAATNNYLFFTANDGENGRGLWKSDGTEKGTVMVAPLDLTLEGGSFSPQLTAFGENIFFKNKGKDTGIELWVGDGISDGAKLLKDINSETKGSRVYSHQLFQEQMIFSTEKQDKLWKTNGVEGGTESFTELTGALGLTNINDNFLFFGSYTEETGFELWKTDGTDSGTQPVKDIRPGVGSSLSSALYNNPLPSFDGIIFFPANDGEHGQELWKSDGTAAGTQMVKDISEGAVGSSLFLELPNTHIIYNGQLYFGADGSQGFGGDRELWVTDGTEAGTFLVKDINSEGASDPLIFMEAGGVLFFTAFSSTSGRELWKIDGSGSDPVLLKDINPGNEGGIPEIINGAEDLVSHRIIDLNGALLFSANDGISGFELWKSDGSFAGTQLLKDIRFGVEGSYPTQLTVMQDMAFFVADDGALGLNLWKSDGTENGTRIVNPGLTFEEITDLTAANDVIFFIADDGIHGRELWKSDGTEEGTKRMSDIIPGAPGSVLNILQYSDGVLYFAADDDQHGEELWVLKALELEATLEAGGSEFCVEGSETTLMASAIAAGEDPQFRWFINDVLMEDQTGKDFTSNNFEEGDLIRVQVIASGDVWVKEDSLFSQTLTISFNPVAEITRSGAQMTASEGVDYEWFLDGELLPDNSQTIEIVEEGVYQVKVTNESGCSALSEEVTVSVTALGDKQKKRKLKIYPNPAVSHLFIDSGINGGVGVSIYDMNGRKMYESTLAPMEEGQKIPVRNLTSGLYTVQCVASDGVIQFKLVKR